MARCSFIASWLVKIGQLQLLVQPLMQRCHLGPDMSYACALIDPKWALQVSPLFNRKLRVAV
jgi:hypothetical protein